MKQINVYFEDEEMVGLKILKGNMSWKSFLITLATKPICEECTKLINNKADIDKKIINQYLK